MADPDLHPDRYVLTERKTILNRQLLALIKMSIDLSEYDEPQQDAVLGLYRELHEIQSAIDALAPAGRGR
jgi:hypothetical protein